jgi:hypothetical protein
VSRPDDTDLKYWQGVADGMAFALDASNTPRGETRDRVWFQLKELRHVCYSSIIGPYCVICHKDLEHPYEPRWSDDV